MLHHSSYHYASCKPTGPIFRSVLFPRLVRYTSRKPVLIVIPHKETDSAHRDAEIKCVVLKHTVYLVPLALKVVDFGCFLNAHCMNFATIQCIQVFVTISEGWFLHLLQSLRKSNRNIRQPNYESMQALPVVVESSWGSQISSSIYSYFQRTGLLKELRSSAHTFLL